MQLNHFISRCSQNCSCKKTSISTTSTYVFLENFRNFKLYYTNGWPSNTDKQIQPENQCQQEPLQALVARLLPGTEAPIYQRQMRMLVNVLQSPVLYRSPEHRPRFQSQRGLLEPLEKSRNKWTFKISTFGTFSALVNNQTIKSHIGNL